VSNFVAAAAGRDSCQILIRMAAAKAANCYAPGLAQNLISAAIYGIIKG
jgi:hypothetical protein